MAGDGEHPASRGPARVVAAAAGLITARDADVRAASDDLEDQVRAARAEGRRAIVLAGSCDASLDVVGALDDEPLGIVWLDAHADFNTPESSVSGFFPGMSLAALTGHCHRDRVRRPPIPEELVVLAGVRDLSPEAERERLAGSAIHAVPWRDRRAEGDALAALDTLARRTRAIYLHVDLDALDPELAPGIVDEPVPGGMSVEDAEAIVAGALERFEVTAASVTTYVPERDVDERTLRVVLRLVDVLTR
jgi:arginase